MSSTTLMKNAAKAYQICVINQKATGATVRRGEVVTRRHGLVLSCVSVSPRHPISVSQCHRVTHHRVSCYSDTMKYLRFIVLLFTPLLANAQTWTAKLDKDVRFYQPTEMGVLIAGTERSVYGLDAETGDTLWRRKDASLDETDVAPVPGTDLLLLSFERGEKSRVEAVDILTGDTIWRSDKIKGSVMHLAVEPNRNLLAMVLARGAKDRAREGFKKRPLIHVLDLVSGRELWKQEAGEVEMMPTRWPDDSNTEVTYTFDNYYPPAFVDDRLFLFYEGVTSFDARTGKNRFRERYKVNENGLALTEAEPVFGNQLIFTSSRGQVRAISRETGETVWEAKDLGVTPELVVLRDVLYVRTGGQFTRLKNGETTERGPYGVSAIDPRTGRVWWRFKGADKGISNLLIPEANTLAVADRDDLIFIDSRSGKRTAKVSHRIERAAFGLLNERGDVVIGGQSEIAAFDPRNGRELWRARHTPPGRGIFRTVAAITARAASLYFRFGGTATTAFRGVQLARSIGGFRWSGLAARSSFTNLQSLATSSARTYVASQSRYFGVASRVRAPSASRNASLNIGSRVRSVDVEDRLLDRLDPAGQLTRLSRFLWHRDRLAALRGHWMYFYTDLKDRDGNGLAGVNVNTGRTERQIRLRELDERFVTDEAIGLMFTANGDKLRSYSVTNR